MRSRLAILATVAVLALTATATPAQAKPGNGNGNGNGKGNGGGGGAAALSFAGYDWDVKSSTGLVGPGPNVFARDNAWVDPSGALHLRIDRRRGTWRSGEVVLQDALGYGTYRFTVESALVDLDPNVVLGLFTWSDDPADNHQEIDIEVSRWGDEANPTNAGYTVQPYQTPSNQHRWSLATDAPTVHEFTWHPDSIVFRSFQGATLLREWVYNGPDTPVAGDATTRMNLWLFRGMAPSERSVEVVVRDFVFVPD